MIPEHIPFGGADPNAKYGRHAGDDSANPCGAEVFAPANGTVTSYTKGQYTGNVVEIFDGQNYLHVFHLKYVAVGPNEQVNEGQLIGLVGTTGLSTGCHLHFGVARKSIPQVNSFNDFLDPLEYIKEGGNMPGTPGQIDKAIKGILGREPTAEELQNPDYKNLGLLVDTLWANGGSQRYAESQTSPEYVKVTDLYIKKI